VSQAARTIVPADASVAEVGSWLAHDRGPFLVATHRNPDGDAIGSMLAMTRALRSAGRDAVMWHPDSPALPEDLAFLLRDDEVVVHELPSDLAERAVIVLDCATAGRLADQTPGELGRFVVNIDHHHDNGRYGDLNLIDGSASSTAQMVVQLLDAAQWPLTDDLAEPLHVGLVTDTGRLSYSNATPDAYRTDARLVETGIDVAAIARRLYENMPIEQARLMGIVYSKARVLLDGALVVAVLDLEDFAAAGTDDADGAAEALRGIRGAEVGALVRSVHDGGIRASLRAASDRVDVSLIARAEGGGGHRAAAGVSSQRNGEEFVAWLASQVEAQLRG
jgi:bifunctional oligoribonuclease and PAP phosphatase NrnA